MKKNILMITIILVVTIITFSVGTYAYFAINFQDERSGKNNNTNLNTELLSDAVVVSNVEESAGSFLIEDIYPGHKEVASIKVDVSGKKDSKIGIKFVYDVKENGLKDNVKISIYKSNKEIKTTNNYFECEKQNETVEGITKYYETCKEKKLELLISETVLNEEVKKLDLVVDTIYISEENQNETSYYYAVVEFINKENSQNEVMSKKLKGNVLVEVVPPVDKTFEESVVAYGNLENNIAESMLYSSHLDKTNLIFDETVDNNLRYVGASPNNYVDFNGEKWRIIGVMNNVSDAEGNKESRIKLIRDESIGSYSWDTSPSNINDGYGINEWSKADLMKLLNPGYESEAIGGSLYWNRKSGNCYNGRNNGYTSCDFSLIGLTELSKNKIAEVLWFTGANDEDVLKWNNLTMKQFYFLERGNNIGKICTSGKTCNDQVERKTMWNGKVGLLYSSDYGYATKELTKCLNSVIYNWNTNSLIECSKENWLRKTNYTFTITPAVYPNYSSDIFCMDPDGIINIHDAANRAFDIYPVLFLNQNVKIISGNGSKENSYQLK